MQNYDVIVVGARVAGSTFATWMAKNGYRVLIVDRTFFPSDVISTHTIFNNTTQVLDELGVLDKLRETDTPEVLVMRATFDDVVIEGQMPAYKGETRSFCFRRTHFDRILLEHAQSFDNVTAIEGFRVTELLWEGDTVVGIRGRNREGQVAEYRATLVIGADGRNSTVRREVGAANKVAVPTEYATYYGYFEGVVQNEQPMFEIFQVGMYRAYMFPTSDQRHVIAVSFPLVDTNMLNAFKADGEKAIRDYYAQHMPRGEERLAQATLAEPVKGILAFNNHWYEGMGKGWALVGDAVCFKDPGMGQGMHDAIYGGRILSNILRSELEWDGNWDEMADQYQTQIEDEFMARFQASCHLTRLQPPEVVAADQAFHEQVPIAGPEAIDRFFGFYNYTAEREELVAAIERAKMAQHKAVS